MYVVIVFFQAEDGIRDLVRSRGLGDVYKRQEQVRPGRVVTALVAEDEAARAAVHALDGLHHQVLSLIHI